MILLICSSDKPEFFIALFLTKVKSSYLSKFFAISVKYGTKILESMLITAC